MRGGFLPPADSTTAARALDASELASALDAIGRDYAAALRMTTDLAPGDRSRCRSKKRGHYRRLLAETLRTVEWLTGAEVAP